VLYEEDVLIIIESHHVQTTLAIGRKIGSKAPSGGIIALHGNLGAGKTTLARGIAQGLGIKEPIVSPTYTIIAEYEGTLRFVHIDAYRLSDEEEFIQTGGEELLGMPGTFTVIEWSEKIFRLLPTTAQQVSLAILDETSRKLSLMGEWIEAIDWKNFIMIQQ